MRASASAGAILIGAALRKVGGAALNPKDSIAKLLKDVPPAAARKRRLARKTDFAVHLAVGPSTGRSGLPAACPRPVPHPRASLLPSIETSAHDVRQ